MMIKHFNCRPFFSFPYFSAPINPVTFFVPIPSSNLREIGMDNKLIPLKLATRDQNQQRSFNDLWLFHPDPWSSSPTGPSPAIHPQSTNLPLSPWLTQTTDLGVITKSCLPSISWPLQPPAPPKHQIMVVEILIRPS